MMELLATVLTVICVSVAIHHFFQNRRRHKILLQTDTRNRRVLFVIAHPDDECMFFAPTILNLRQFGQYDLFLLCLSSGNFNNQGKVRQQELIESCRLLGIRENNVFILDRRDLSDDPSLLWEKTLIAKLMAEYVKEYYIDLIFTFDEYGVSGHLNHQSVYYGCRHFLSSSDCTAGLEGYKLISINIFRKYASILELTISYFTSDMIFISCWSDVWKAQAAMYKHKSQFIWFRVLYILFSRYMIINTYKPMVSVKRNGRS